MGDTESEEPSLFYCDNINQLQQLEEEFGIAAKWVVPRNPKFAPDWESRWKWKPEDGLGFPFHGTDVY